MLRMGFQLEVLLKSFFVSLQSKMFKILYGFMVVLSCIAQKGSAWVFKKVQRSHTQK